MGNDPLDEFWSAEEEAADIRGPDTEIVTTLYLDTTLNVQQIIEFLRSVAEEPGTVFPIVVVTSLDPDDTVTTRCADAAQFLDYITTWDSMTRSVISP